MLLYFFLFETLMVLYLVGATFLFYARLPKPQAFILQEGDRPLVSVIIPTCNHEKNIGRCLESLLKQEYQNIEILLIDDGSTDKTGDIVEEMARANPTIKQVPNTCAPPAGWTGKNHALVQAVEHARGEFILFSYANTWHFPSSVQNAIAYARSKKAHLVSFWPLHELGTIGEKLITPALWSSFFWLDPFQKVNDFAFEEAYAIDHSMLVDRNAYLAVGGHMSIHDWIVEDHALAMLMKRRGFHVQMADGSKLLKVRMYTSFDEFWHGWSRMLFAVIRYKGDALFGVNLYIVCALVLPFVELAILIYKWQVGAPPSQLHTLGPLVGIQFAALLAWRVRIATHFENLGWAFFPLLPVSGLILCACYLNSGILVLTGAEGQLEEGQKILGQPSLASRGRLIGAAIP